MRLALRGRSRLALQVGLFAFRDPFGIRPLVLGHRVSEEGPEWCFASEDCAFGPLGFIKVCLALHALPCAQFASKPHARRCATCGPARRS